MMCMCVVLSVTGNSWFCFGTTSSKSQLASVQSQLKWDGTEPSLLYDTKKRFDPVA